MRTDQETTVGSMGRSEPHLVPARRRSLWSRLFSALGWLLLGAVVLAGLAAALTTFVEPPPRLRAWLPERTGLAGAVTLTTALTGLAAHRSGSRTVVATVFAAFASVSAVLSGWSWLLAGAVAFTAFVTAVLAVVATRPARGVPGVFGEYVAALGLALVGAVAAAAYQAPVRPMVLTDVVSLAAVLATLWVAYRLAGGAGGLGTRGAVVLIGSVAVIVVGVAYSEALRRWGSPGVVDMIGDLTSSTRGLLGALPSPLEVLIGFPALVWGLGTRAELRQGWWVCAFGAFATAGVTTSLAAPGVDVAETLLGTGYAAAIGLILGLLIWRVDLRLTGRRHQRQQGGRRVRRADRARPMRPEPSRTGPLM